MNALTFKLPDLGEGLQEAEIVSWHVAEGDHVVVQCRGKVTTKAGQPYNNHYCFVCRLSGGKLRELTEYMDTELAAQALGAP